MSSQITYFHVPGTKSINRDMPGKHGQEDAFGASLEGWVFPPKETLVTIHGLEGKRFRVVETQLHIGHPDELEGVHVILEEDRQHKGWPAPEGGGVESLTAR